MRPAQSSRCFTHRHLQLAVLEAIERRRLLSTVIVNTLADETTPNATTSLREAITQAAAGDTVQFKAGLVGTITLGGQELFIQKSVTIVGPGAAKLTVSGNNAGRVFSIDAAVTATISGLTVAAGSAEAGAGIYNGSNLTLNKVTIVANTARGADGGFAGGVGVGDGGVGRGGGIYTSGKLTLVDCTLSDNHAVGGIGKDGANPGMGGDGLGGAIYNEVGGVVNISGGVISNGTAEGGISMASSQAGAGGNARGGALFNAGAATITDTDVLDNFAVGADGGDGQLLGESGGGATGGAVYSTGTLNVVKSVFSTNVAWGGEGGIATDYPAFTRARGGDAFGGAICATGALNVSETAFTVNEAHGGNSSNVLGGGIYVTGALTMNACSVAQNIATANVTPQNSAGQNGGNAIGGGIYSDGAGSITASTINDNEVTGGSGGPGYVFHTEHAAGNGGLAGGGGAYAGGGLPLNVINSTIVNNTVTGGNGGDVGPTLTLPPGNAGPVVGAGIYAQANGVALLSSTIARNRCVAGQSTGDDGTPAGGGILADGNVQLANTIVAGNVADIGRDVAGAVASDGFNLIGAKDDSLGWIASDLTGTATTPLDAKLGVLAFNGGPTQTLAPRADSPAIDKGKALGLTADQRGWLRTFDLPGKINGAGSDATDIGAVELQPYPFAGMPLSIAAAGPTRIEAESFAEGGEGLAYHDVDAANLGHVSRSTGVDLQPTSDAGGGYNVGWAKAGEWLSYVVDVSAAGAYDVAFRVASDGVGGKFHLEVDGKNATGQLAIANTGGWQSWKTLSKAGVNLTAGRHVLRLVMDSAGASGSVGNFNCLTFTPSAPAANVTVKAASATHVRDGSYYATNFGLSPTLEVKKSTLGYNRETYLKFDLSGVATIGTAKLRLYAALGDAPTPSLQLSIGTSPVTNWSESGLVWDNKPASGAGLATLTISGTASKWYEVDLTSILRAEKAAGHQLVTLVVKSQTASSTLCTIHSDETAHVPELVITS